MGSRLVVPVAGTAPGAALLARIRRGQVAGVILFRRNVSSPAQVRALTGALQRAARLGGHLPLLICVDQEGGSVRRLTWAPPARPAVELGALGAAAVRAEGRATGRALRAVGVNCDLAPVADVPVRGSFVGDRGWGTDPVAVARLAGAFADGLADAGVLGAAKHFPGLGRAGVSTDVRRVRIGATRAALERDLLPFRRLVEGGVPLVMVSNASYRPWGPVAAVWSPAVVDGLLRRELGFRGVTITDALEPLARTRGWPGPERAAVAAAEAGVDLLLLTAAERSAGTTHAALLAAARAGALRRVVLERSAARVDALRRLLTAAP